MTRAYAGRARAHAGCGERVLVGGGVCAARGGDRQCRETQTAWHGLGQFHSKRRAKLTAVRGAQPNGLRIPAMAGSRPRLACDYPACSAVLGSASRARPGPRNVLQMCCAGDGAASGGYLTEGKASARSGCCTPGSALAQRDVWSSRWGWKMSGSPAFSIASSSDVPPLVLRRSVLRSASQAPNSDEEPAVHPVSERVDPLRLRWLSRSLTFQTCVIGGEMPDVVFCFAGALTEPSEKREWSHWWSKSARRTRI